MTTESSGPYLVAALLCEKVLQEKDETISVIRMIDRITLTVSALGSPETIPSTIINLSSKLPHVVVHGSYDILFASFPRPYNHEGNYKYSQ